MENKTYTREEVVALHNEFMNYMNDLLMMGEYNHILIFKEWLDKKEA